MIYHAPEPDGEGNPKDRDPGFKKALEEYVAATEPTLVVNPETNEEDTHLSDLIEDDGSLEPEIRNKIKEVFDDEEWEKIEERSNSRRHYKVEPGDNGDYLKKNELLEDRLSRRIKTKKEAEHKDCSLEIYILNKIKEYDKKSEERSLLKKILDYESDEMFSYSTSGVEAAEASDGRKLIKAFAYILKKKEITVVRHETRGIMRRYGRKHQPMPEKLKFLINEVEYLAEKRLEEQTTRHEVQIQEESQEITERKHGPSKLKRGKYGRLIVPKD